MKRMKSYRLKYQRAGKFLVARVDAENKKQAAVIYFARIRQHGDKLTYLVEVA